MKVFLAGRNETLEMTGANILRDAVGLLDCCDESFLDPFTPAQLIQIVIMCWASKWDFRPDQWTQEQVQDALAGIVPEWDQQEEPLYSTVFWIRTEGDEKIGPFKTATEAGENWPEREKGPWPEGKKVHLVADYRDGGGIGQVSDKDLDAALVAMLRARKGSKS